MPIRIRTWTLANGLQVEIFDHAVSYYGDHATIKLTICCNIEVRQEYIEAFKTHPRRDEIAKTLGGVARYQREILKAGVPAKHLSAMKTFLVEKFEENALGYFERDDFPRKFVAKRFTEIADELAKKERSGNGG